MYDFWGLESDSFAKVLAATASMAPKLSQKAVATIRTKKAGELLKDSKQVKDLADQRKALKATLRKLSHQKKKASRAARKLKMKAAKTDLNELLQMIIMKAYIVAEESKAKEGGSSSSTDPWIPQNAKEAFEQNQESCPDHDVDVAKFAQILKEGV